MAEKSLINDLLADAVRGVPGATDQLFDRVYDELKGIARARLRRSGGALTINPTTLVHETWIRFSRVDLRTIEGAEHFYNIVAKAMRQILHDMVLRKMTVKQGSAYVRAQITDGIEAPDKPVEELLAVHRALEDLQSFDADLSRLVEWHYFAGLSIEEIAHLRSTSERTVKRNLALARAFLHDAMREEPQ